jgi:hypothetical protein
MQIGRKNSVLCLMLRYKKPSEDMSAMDDIMMFVIHQPDLQCEPPPPQNPFQSADNEYIVRRLGSHCFAVETRKQWQSEPLADVAIQPDDQREP